jgi:hypothetical protein
MVNAALKNAASVTVRRDLDAISRYSVVDELYLLHQRCKHTKTHEGTPPDCPPAKACSSTFE